MFIDALFILPIKLPFSLGCKQHAMENQSTNTQDSKMPEKVNKTYKRRMTERRKEQNREAQRVFRKNFHSFHHERTTITKESKISNESSAGAKQKSQQSGQPPPNTSSEIPSTSTFNEVLVGPSEICEEEFVFPSYGNSCFDLPFDQTSEPFPGYCSVANTDGIPFGTGTYSMPSELMDSCPLDFYNLQFPSECSSISQEQVVSRGHESGVNPFLTTQLMLRDSQQRAFSHPYIPDGHIREPRERDLLPLQGPSITFARSQGQIDQARNVNRGS